MPTNQNTGRTWREGNDGSSDRDRDEWRSETISGRRSMIDRDDRDRDIWDRERHDVRSFNEYGRDDDERDFSYGSRYDRDLQNRSEQRDRVMRGETGAGGMERIRAMRSEIGDRGVGQGVAYERSFDRGSFDRGSFDRGMGQGGSFDRSYERSFDRDRNLGFGYGGSQYGSQYGSGTSSHHGSQYSSGYSPHYGSQVSRGQQHYAPQYSGSAYGSQFGFGSQYGTHSSGYGTEGTWGHRGKGPRNFIRSDERIREIVCETLADDDRVDASDIDVRVRDGEVILTGTVHDRRSKRIAEDIIEDLRGVKDVQNQIRVMRGDPRETNIDQMNSFLRGELSAVETYRMALDKLDKGSSARAELETCMRSHEERVQMLREQIRRVGGTPSTSSGAWGVFAKVVEGGARALGDKAAIAALEEGEDHGLRDYRDNVDKLDRDMRSIVSTRLLAEQENTHLRMSTLKKRLQS